MARKAKTETAPEPQAPQSGPEQKQEPKPEAKSASAVADRDPSFAEQVAESRKALKHPLAPGQRFFESPEGFVVVGEADRNHVWCRQANGGKGCWINQRR